MKEQIHQTPVINKFVPLKPSYNAKPVVILHWDVYVCVHDLKTIKIQCTIDIFFVNVCKKLIK